MKTTSEIWYEVYDIGINQGLDNFNEKQLYLFSYIDLLYSLEMGGLSSLLYNCIGDQQKLNSYLSTLGYFAFDDLTKKLIYFEGKFREVYDGREETWDDFLGRTGVNDELTILDNEILEIITEARMSDWIIENYQELNSNL